MANLSMNGFYSDIFIDLAESNVSIKTIKKSLK